MKSRHLFLSAVAMAALSLASCGDDDVKGSGISTTTKVDKTEDEVVDVPEVPVDPSTDLIRVDYGDWTIPTFADDYRKISGWGSHSKWNLANVHDPSVFYWPADGYYYMFGTDASFGNEHDKATDGKHYQGKRSKDLVNWEYVRGIMDEFPEWAVVKINSIRTKMGLAEIHKSNFSMLFWAPVARVVNNKVRLYYCVGIDNYISNGARPETPFPNSWSERALIGVMETDDPNGGPSAWTDLGYVTGSSSDKGKNYYRKSLDAWDDAYFFYNAIDPTYIEASDGKHYLIHGSWHSGLALLEINPETGKPFKNTEADPWADGYDALSVNFGVRIGTRGISRWQGSEGPEIIEKDGVFYLFFANDPLDVAYQTRVVRSVNGIEGPYYDITGHQFTNGNCPNPLPLVTHPYKFSDDSRGWVGISHCAIFQHNDTKEWFYMSQARFPYSATDTWAPNAVMLGHVRKIAWCPKSAEDGSELWPIAYPERYANCPKADIKETDIVGKWENINLTYVPRQFKEEDVPFSNRVMNVSKSVEFNADKTVSGAIKGTWSYDADKRWLTIDVNGTKSVLVVDAELDWEASPRHITLVYTGIDSKSFVTYWGKKVANASK